MNTMTDTWTTFSADAGQGAYAVAYRCNPDTGCVVRRTTDRSGSAVIVSYHEAQCPDGLEWSTEPEVDGNSVPSAYMDSLGWSEGYADTLGWNEGGAA